MSNMNTQVLTSLLAETWGSPVFGDSFGAQTPKRTLAVLQQITEIMTLFENDFIKALRVGMPGVSDAELQKVIGQIAPKTVVFCPALAAGEVADTARLAAFASAIGIMYWGDQTMDRGDRAMPYAIQLFAGQRPRVSKKFVAQAHAQAEALRLIRNNVDFFARPEDAPYVFDCFSEQVLLNEVRVQKLSQQYLESADKDAFLARHGKDLAKFITIDAGFPSVSSSLYALYRQENQALPALAEVYADPTMVELLQACNAVVRILDELGDWEMDSGKRADWGVFTLNPFNQPHEAFVGNLLALAGLETPELIRAFKEFHGNREGCSELVVAALLDHIKTYIGNLRPDKFDYYVVLCKRVLEIGYINRVGDIALAG